MMPYRQLELDRRLGLGRRAIRDFISEVRRRMPANPYHCWPHVADVTQAAYALAARSGVLRGMPDPERLALLLAALCHDLEHPVPAPHPSHVPLRGRVAPVSTADTSLVSLPAPLDASSKQIEGERRKEGLVRGRIRVHRGQS